MFRRNTKQNVGQRMMEGATSEKEIKEDLFGELRFDPNTEQSEGTSPVDLGKWDSGGGTGRCKGLRCTEFAWCVPSSPA